MQNSEYRMKPIDSTKTYGALAFSIRYSPFDILNQGELPNLRTVHAS